MQLFVKPSKLCFHLQNMKALVVYLKSEIAFYFRDYNSFDINQLFRYYAVYL